MRAELAISVISCLTRALRIIFNKNIYMLIDQA